MGELGLFYRLVPVAMIGGSFADVGGHNLMEPAQLGCAILHGPDMKKTQAVADEMARTGGAIQCADGGTLADTVGQLLQDSERRTALAEAAKAVADKHTGVIDRVCDRLAPCLDGLREGSA
jgi:3-deoxy-D-manno-octulosonic-acid transferase